MQQPIEQQRKTLSFILGNAIQNKYKDVLLIQNGVTSDGFYYDIEGDIKLEDLEDIKKEMDEIISKTFVVEQMTLSKKDAVKTFENNKHKIKSLENYDFVDVIKFNNFIDLSSDILNFQDILTDAFQLNTITKVDENILRIKGVSFNNIYELKENL